MTAVHVENRLHLVLAWSAEIRGLLQQIVRTTIRSEPIVRILTRLGPALTLPSGQRPSRPSVDRAQPRAAALRALPVAQERRREVFMRRWLPIDRSFPRRLAGVRFAVHADGAVPMPHRPAGISSLRRGMRRVRKGLPVDSLEASPRSLRLAARRGVALRSHSGPLVTGDVPMGRPLRRVFRQTQQAPRVIVPPRRVELVWRKPPAGEAARAGETMSQGMRRGAPSPAHSASAEATGVSACVSAAPNAFRSSQASAIQINSATMNRLTHEVIGRIEQKLRVERERRGG